METLFKCKKFTLKDKNKQETWLRSKNLTFFLEKKKAICMCPSLLSKSTLLVWKIEEDIVQQVDGIFFF